MTELPRDGSGRIQWSKVPTFVGWLKTAGPHLTNLEMAAEIKKLYGVDVTAAVIESLRKQFGARQTSETIARAYKARTEGRGPLPEQPRTIPTVEAKVEPEKKEELTPVQQLEQENLAQEVKRLSAKQTFYEMVGEKIIQAVRELPSLQVNEPVESPQPAPGLSEEEMILLISDVQAGQVTSAKESGGLGEYNSVILLQQLEYLERAIDNIRPYHQNVKKLNIFFLGDIVDGETIFPGQQRLVDMNVIEQCVFVWEKFSRFIQHQAERFDAVKCFGVVGNHGRVGFKGEHAPLSNFDYLVYKMLEQRLRVVPNVSWDISESWWQMATVQGWNFLLVHGDDTGAGSWGIPFYGINRTKVRYREMFQIRGMEDFDLMVCAHHHEPSQFQRIIVNGSWPGSSELSAKKMQLISDPTQTLLAVHKKYGVTWRREINLRPLPPRAAMEEAA